MLSPVISLSLNQSYVDLMDEPFSAQGFGWMVALKELRSMFFNVQVEISNECCSSGIDIGNSTA